jgi:hypothetical protein
VTVHQFLQVPSEALRVGTSLAMWDCVLVTSHEDRDHVRGLAELFKDKAGAVQTLVLDTRLPHGNVVEVLASVASATRESSAHGVAVHKLEEATRALDAVLETLPSAATAVASRDVQAPVQPTPTVQTVDPVQRAIETRDHLEKTVEFVDSTKWAKWRRVKSNPAAVLGKYKRQHRAFAVRSSKRDLYPVFQFAANAEPLAIMRQILEAVPQESQGWPLLSWFEARNRLLAGRKPSELLAIDPERVLSAAQRFYSRDA